MNIDIPESLQTQNTKQNKTTIVIEPKLPGHPNQKLGNDSEVFPFITLYIEF